VRGKKTLSIQSLMLCDRKKQIIMIHQERKIKFQKLKTFWMKIENIGIFFLSNVAQGVTSNLSRLFSSYKALSSIWSPIILSNNKK
jgi:hypothetical protein